MYNCDKPCNHNYQVTESDDTHISNHTSSYTIDGIINRKETNTVKNAWNKAKQERVINNSFSDTPWLASIAKDFRQR
jgi:hypothetical protein